MTPTDETTRTFETPDPVTVRVLNASGHVSVVTADGPTSTVTLHPLDDRGRDAVAAADVRLDGDALLVDVPRQRGLLGRAPQVDVRVTVPTGSSTRVSCESAEVDLDGTFAGAEVASGSGDVTVRGTVEDARLTTGSGDLDVEEVTGELRATTGSGDVTVRTVLGTGTLSTGSGDVGVERGEGALVTKTGSGDVVVRRHRGSLQARSGSGDLRVDATSGGAVTATSGSGDVAVGIADGAPVWLDLTTVTGDVRNELDASEAPEEEADLALAVELRAKTATGDVTVRRA